MIDLHCHTAESDGTDSPAELLRRAAALGLTAVAITDHDTLRGCDLAAAEPPPCVRVVHGIELSARLAGESDPRRRVVHLLGYFFAPPRAGFREWLDSLRAARRARNVALAARLLHLGIEASLDEAEAIGHNITGRPHFARVMISKGYVKDYAEAFDRYLGEGKAAYVEREDPDAEEGIARLRAAGAVVSLAHPRRLNQPSRDKELRLFARWRDAGLQALEAIHPDHDKAARRRYRIMAANLGLALSGGTDYHGDAKPHIALGAGCRDNVRVPDETLDALQALSTAAPPASASAVPDRSASART